MFRVGGCGPGAPGKVDEGRSTSHGSLFFPSFCRMAEMVCRALSLLDSIHVLPVLPSHTVPSVRPVRP